MKSLRACKGERDELDEQSEGGVSMSCRKEQTTKAAASIESFPSRLAYIRQPIDLLSIIPLPHALWCAGRTKTTRSIETPIVHKANN